MTATTFHSPLDAGLNTAELLLEARQHERAGRLREAMDCCMAAVAEAAWCGAAAAQAVGLRRLSVLHHRQNDPVAAKEACLSSVEVALQAGEPALAAESLISLGNFELASGNVEDARSRYREALATLGSDSQDLRVRIERSLQVLARAQGRKTRAA